jgi:hypothetical protein
MTEEKRCTFTTEYDKGYEQGRKEVIDHVKVRCPLCGKMHELKYAYKSMPLLACPEAKPDTIYCFKEEV